MFQIGDKVRPTISIYGDPEVMTITEIGESFPESYKTDLYSRWFKGNELELVVEVLTAEQALAELNEVEETYTREEVKQYAFWAVQYATRLEEENPGKLIHKSQIDEYLDTEF